MSVVEERQDMNQTQDFQHLPAKISVKCRTNTSRSLSGNELG